MCAEFKQVFTTALEGFVPIDIIKTLTAFLDFCYIARQDTLTEDSLDALDNALMKFHHHRKIFQESGVRPTGFSLPRQHSLTHYHHHIEKFGAPNGLSSSITESKHITAVKKPWRRSSRYEALGQMLTINTRNDKLASARIDFSSRGMLDGTCLGEVLEIFRSIPKDTNDNSSDVEDGSGSGSESGQDLDANEDEGGQDLDANEDEDGTGPVDNLPSFSEVALAQKRGVYHLLFLCIRLFLKGNTARGYPLTSFWELGRHIRQENLEELVRVFLFFQQNPAFTGTPPITACPTVESIEEISVFHSAKAVFHAPSNPSGIGELYRETIRCTPKWKTSGIIAPRRDCVLLNTGSDIAGVMSWRSSLPRRYA